MTDKIKMTEQGKKLVSDAIEKAEQCTCENKQTLKAIDIARDEVGKAISKALNSSDGINVPAVLDAGVEAICVIGAALAPDREIGSHMISDMLSQNRDFVVITSQDPDAKFWCSLSE